MFGLPDPDALVRGTDPAPDPYLYLQAEMERKTCISPVLRLLYDFSSSKNYVNVASKIYKKT
jgi:hypothetical protein